MVDQNRQMIGVDYRVVRPLGMGAFGDTHLVERLADNVRIMKCNFERNDWH